MQDEINEKVIALSIRTTKLTAEMLQKSIRFMLSQIKKQLDKPVQHHGKQTLISSLLQSLTVRRSAEIECRQTSDSLSDTLKCRISAFTIYAIRQLPICTN